jgi:hypothetical protein
MYQFNSGNEGFQDAARTACPFSVVCATQLGLAVADVPPVEVGGGAAHILPATSSTPDKHLNPHIVR